MPLGSCWGFCFAVLFWTLVSTIYLFHEFFHVCFQASLFLLFWKNKPNNKLQALHAIPCPLCVSSRLFSPFYCQISQKKKIICIHYPSRPPFCLKLKGHWWHPSGQTVVLSLDSFHLWATSSSSSPSNQSPFFPLSALFRLPTAGLPPSQALALCSFSACKSLICTWNGLFSWSGLWNRSELHIQTWQLGFRKTSLSRWSQMVWSQRIFRLWDHPASPCFAQISSIRPYPSLGFLITLVPKLVME